MTVSMQAWLHRGGWPALAAAAAVTAVAVGGCTAVPAGRPSALLAASPAPPSPAPPVILTGTRLRSLLVPASAIPGGFPVGPAGARDSGGTVASDTAAPPPPGKVCGLLTGTSWLLSAGISGAAFAENDYASARRTAEIGQEIDAFQGTDAHRVMSRLWQVFQRCAAFAIRYHGASAMVTGRRSRLTVAGAPAVRLVMTSPLYRGGETLVAVRAGNNVITCFCSTPGRGHGSAAIALAARLIRRVRAAAAAAGQRP